MSATSDPREEIWYVSITDFPNGLGSTTRARSMCTALLRAGRRPRLLIPYAIGHAANKQASGIEDGLPFEYLNGSTERPRGARRVVQAKVRGGLRLARRIWRARRTLSSLFLYNMSGFDAWPVVLTARVLRIPVVMDITDEWHDPSVPIRRLGFARYCFQLLSVALEFIVFRGASRIIVVTRHLERRVERYKSKVHRLPMLFDPDRFEDGTAERTGAAGPSILYAGNISTLEGIDILIEAMAQLTGGAGAATLRIIGAPTQGDSIERYRDLAVRLGVADRVAFLPPLDRDKYAAALRGADLLVVPRTTSRGSQAGFPYKLGEYLATGRPVVVTRFGDVEEYFAAGRDCLMCAPDDPAALAATLQYALEHGDEARAIGQRGQRRVRELFSFEAVAGQLDRMLREIA
jgi:glycosyltransferase involved in cell wall biosynthesis